jgi:hypothetical protein
MGGGGDARVIESSWPLVEGVAEMRRMEGIAGGTRHWSERSLVRK